MTDKDAIKFSKAGVQDMRVAQAATDIGLDKMKFDEASIKQQIDDELDSLYDDAKIGMYNGEPIILTEDSQAITGIILGEIKALEEQGAPLSEVESARASIDNPTFRRRYLKQYQAAQELTISQWVYALRKSDFSSAFNYLMLDAVLSHNYDFNLNKYFKRNSKTVRNITPYDPGTLAELYASDNSKELLIDYVKIQVKNMGNIVKANKFKTDSDGTWVKFNGGNTQTREDIDANASALSQLVQNTYWCTKTNANSQLSGGDFYVYVTESSSGEFEPKIAIRMNGSSIGEVRGNASQAQDIEPAMLGKAEAFLINDIPGTDGDKWVNSMRFNKKVESLSKSIAGRPLSKEDYMEYISIKADASKYSIDRSENGYVQTLSNIVDEKVKNNDLVDRFIVTDPADIIPGVTIALIGSYETIVLDKGVDMSGIEFIYGDLDVNSDWSDLKNIKSISGNLSIASPSVKTLGNLESAGAVDFFSAGIESLGNLRSTNMAINFDFVSKFDTPWFRDLSDFGKLEEIGQGSWKTISIPPKIKTINGPTKITGVVRFQDTANDHVVSLGTVKEINGELIVGSGLESLGDLEIVSDNVTIDISAKIDSLGKLKQADGIRVFGPNVKSISGLNKAPSIVAGPDVEVIDLNGTDISSLEMRGSSDIKNIDYINELIIETLLNEKDNSQLTISTPSPGSLKFVNKLSVYTGKSGFNFGNLLSVSFLNVKTSGKVSAGKNGVKVNVIGWFKSEDNILPGVKSINNLQSTGISSIPDLKFAGETFFEQAVKKGFNNSSDEYASILNRYISNQELSGTPALQDIINAAVSTLNGVIKEKENLDKQNAPAIRERKATPVSMTAQESTEFDDLLRVEGGEKQTTIKPLAVREKKMTDQEIRDNLDRRAKKLFPSDADVFTPDDFRVYFLDDNFKPIKGMENVSKMYQKIAENDGVYMLFGMGLRGGFMFTDQARGGEEIDIEFELDKVSPYTGTGSPDSVYISAIQVLSREGQSKGAGTRLMNRIIEAADELGIPLELEAYPTKKFQRGERGEFSETTKQKMSKRLVEFYKKFGFTPIAKTGPDANMMIRQPQPLVRERKAGERKSLEQIKAENAAKREESRNKRMLERKELMEKARERFDTAAQKAKEEKEQAKQAEETLNNAIDEYVNAIINADNAKDINAKLKDLRKVAGTLDKTIFAKQMRKIAATLKKKGAISDVSVTTLNRILKTIERVGDENYQQEVERALNALKQEINAKLRRELNSMRKKALKNIQGGAIGTSALKPLFQKVLSIDAKMIPDSVFDDYNAIVRRLGASQSVLSLDDKEKFRAAMNDILDVIDAESRKLVELGELYRDYISSEKGAADMAYAVVADNMLSLGIINNEDRELMRRYKSIITAEAERAGYTAAEKGDMSEEAEVERLALIDEIKSIDVDVSTIDSRESRDAAKELLKNLNQVENMSNPELRKLVRVLQNMSSGFFPHEAQLMLKRLTAMRDSEVLSSAINEAKLLKTEAIVANIKGVVKRMLQYKYSETTPSLIAAERNPTPFIDNVFGNFKGKPIYNTLIRPLASAIASFQRDYDVAVNDMSTAEKRLVDSFMRNGNAVRSSKYKIQMYLLQREYNSNQGNPEVIPASKWIKSTLAAIDDTTLYNPATGAELRELLTKYSRDGEVSTELIEKSLTPAEKNFIATIDKINNSLRDKALHVSDVIRGEGIQARDNYVHINVMYMGRDAVRSEVKDIINRYTASTKSKSLITRAGSAAPINLDPYTSVLRGARMTLLDYHMTPALQQTNSTLAMTDKKVSGNARQTLTAIKEMMKGLTDNILTNSVGSSSSIEQYITRAGYRAVLSSIPSRSAEFISNLGMAFAAPTDYLSGSKIYSKIGNDLSIGDFMKNAGSTQVNRVSDGETLTNKQIESNPFRNLAGASVAIQNDVANVMSIIGRAMKRHTVDVSSKIADEIISFSDKHVAKRVWIGKFDSKFKELTGSSPDLKKIADNDEAYMDKYSKSIKEATKTADDMVIIVAASTNPYDAIMKLQDKPDAGTLKKIASSINTFMSRFQIYDFNIARAAVNEMMGNGSMSREYGARILAGVALRTMLYTLAADYLAGLFSVTVRSLMAELGLIDDLDEDEFIDALMPDEDTPYATIRAFGGSIANLVINRNFGNIVKNLFSFGIETVNKEHMDALRNGEAYDPYENNILVSQIPTELNRGQTAGEALIGAFSGPLGPINKATMRGIKVADRAVTGKSPRTRVNAMQELQTRTPIELAGSLGVIPLYKDVRNVMLDIMYKKYDKKKKPKK
jgi:GNAT superfamily N-acetyltransferase